MIVHSILRNRPVFYIFLIWLCLFLYLFNSLWLKQHSEGFLWYLSVCYINDFLAPIVLLSITGIALFISGRRMNRFWQVLLLTLAFGSFWEFGSFFISGTVFDPVDFVAYIAGGSLFWIVDIYRQPLRRIGA